MSFIDPNPFTPRPEIDGTFGVVASRGGRRRRVAANPRGTQGYAAGR